MECRREPLAGQLAEIRRLVVTTESLTLATASETLTLSWCKVDEVVEAPEHVFIRFGGNFAVVVPNACFKDASAKNDFLETVYRSYNDQP
jgi:hypothetical protein